ncbi:MAG: hypothetical protein N2V76_11145, partial [Methanophagales archaeon]|nr:hypothetical protein [Methanophagales archaeon]
EKRMSVNMQEINSKLWIMGWIMEGAIKVLNLNLNLRPIHGKILALLGREYERMYCTIYGRKSVRTT